LVHIPGEKNTQADVLSQQPDLCPQGADNEDIIVLPEHLFVSLINMKLQKEIANAKNMDYDAAEALKESLEQEPKEAKKNLEDWKVKEFKGETYCSTRERTMYQLMRNSKGKLSEDTTIILWQVIQGSSRHLTQSKSITGGQDFKSLSRIMFRDVEYVNNSKLMEIQ
jgi:hypothetical protein